MVKKACILETSGNVMCFRTAYYNHRGNQIAADDRFEMAFLLQLFVGSNAHRRSLYRKGPWTGVELPLAFSAFIVSGISRCEGGCKVEQSSLQTGSS